MGKIGYLKDGPSDFNATSAGLPLEKFKAWKARESAMYSNVADFCNERRCHWEKTIGPAVAKLDKSTLAGRTAVTQYETDRRLLLRCAQFMSSRAEVLAKGG